MEEDRPVRWTSYAGGAWTRATDEEISQAHGASVRAAAEEIMRRMEDDPALAAKFDKSMAEWAALPKAEIERALAAYRWPPRLEPPNDYDPESGAHG